MPQVAAPALTDLTEVERMRERVGTLSRDLQAKITEVSDMRVYAQHLEAEVVRLQGELAKKAEPAKK